MLLIKRFNLTNTHDLDQVAQIGVVNEEGVGPYKNASQEMRGTVVCCPVFQKPLTSSSTITATKQWMSIGVFHAIASL